MNKPLFTSKEITILESMILQKKREYKKMLNNPLNNELVNSCIKESIQDLNIILKKIKNPNYKINSFSYKDLYDFQNRNPSEDFNFNEYIQKEFSKNG